MAAWSKSVFSSMVSSISYDPDTQEMVVQWTRGGSGVYSGVPEDAADELTRSASVGTMINTEFKGVYPYRKL